MIFTLRKINNNNDVRQIDIKFHKLLGNFSFKFLQLDSETIYKNFVQYC